MNQRDTLPDQSGVESEAERLAHGICDALKFLPPPTKCAGTAILRGLLIGTGHEGHNDDTWPSAASDEKCP